MSNFVCQHCDLIVFGESDHGLCPLCAKSRDEIGYRRFIARVWIGCAFLFISVAWVLMTAHPHSWVNTIPAASACAAASLALVAVNRHRSALNEYLR